MNIRECSPDDLDTIIQYTLALHRHENETDLQPHPNLSDNLKKWLEAEIFSNNSLILIAEIDNKPVGFICAATVINDNGLIAQPLKGVIQLLWIEPAYRKQKLANELVKMVELCLQESGVTYVECSFVEGNSMAKNFWSEQGYQIAALTCRKFLKNDI